MLQGYAKGYDADILLVQSLKIQWIDLPTKVLFVL